MKFLLQLRKRLLPSRLRMALKRRVYRIRGWLPEGDVDEGNLVRFGAAGAPWIIRADLLGAAPTVISAGLSDDVEFEEEFLQKHAGKMVALDPTPLSRRPAQGLIAAHGADRVTFVPHALAGREGVQAYLAEIDPASGETVYYYSENCGGPPPAEYAGGRDDAVPPRIKKTTVHSCTVAQLMAEHDLVDLDLLKLDIEGSEYAVIDSVLDAGLAVRQIAVEFHHRFAGIGAGKTTRAISRLRRNGYQLVWVSNWGEEFLFVRA